MSKLGRREPRAAIADRGPENDLTKKYKLFRVEGILFWILQLYSTTYIFIGRK